MKILSAFNEIIDKAKNGILRFPITIIWAILGTLFTIWFIDQDFSGNEDFKYAKIMLTSILGVSWLIATRLLVNYFKEEKKENKAWLMLFPLLFLGIYYFTLPNNEVAFDDLTIPYRFVLFLVTGHLFIFFSSFLFTWDKKAYWNYLIAIFGGFAQSAIFSLVLYLGLTIALMALKYLFHFEVKSIRYFQLFVLCLGVVNTWIFLSDLPKNLTKQTTIHYPKPLLVFVKYILIPLTLLYLVILYAYSFKILINWSLPKGWVSYLVVALSILGFIIHILINPIRKTSESRLIKNFYPRFYYALLPMIVLLFIAIFKRIGDYGFTENRYLVLLLAIWILGMTLYILLSKGKKLRYFPMSVAILSLLVSFGFWGVFSVAKNSQAHQFKKLYAQMKSADFKIKNTDKESFRSVINYLNKRNAIDKVSDVLGYNPNEIFKSKDNAGLKYYSRYQITDRLMDTLNIKVTDYNSKLNHNGHYYYNAKHTDLVEIKGYDFMKKAYFSSQNNNYRNAKFENENALKNYDFKLDTVSKTAIYMMKNKDTIQKIELKSFLEGLENVKFDRNYSQIDQKHLIVENDYETIKLKILFHNLELRNKDNDKSIPLEILSAGGTVLLKEKLKK